jgi:hypothetical protein
MVAADNERLFWAPVRACLGVKLTVDEVVGAGRVRHHHYSPSWQLASNTLIPAAQVEITEMGSPWSS